MGLARLTVFEYLKKLEEAIDGLYKLNKLCILYKLNDASVEVEGVPSVWSLLL